MTTKAPRTRGHVIWSGEGLTVVSLTNQIAAGGDPPVKQRTIRSGRLQPLVSVVSTNCKQSSALFLPEFSAKLESDVCGDTSGHYQKLLVILLQVERRDPFPHNESLWWCHYKVMSGLGVDWGKRVMTARSTNVWLSVVFGLNNLSASWPLVR